MFFPMKFWCILLGIVAFMSKLLYYTTVQLVLLLQKVYYFKYNCYYYYYYYYYNYRMKAVGVSFVRPNVHALSHSTSSFAYTKLTQLIWSRHLCIWLWLPMSSIMDGACVLCTVDFPRLKKYSVLFVVIMSVALTANCFYKNDNNNIQAVLVFAANFTNCCMVVVMNID